MQSRNRLTVCGSLGRAIGFVEVWLFHPAKQRFRINTERARCSLKLPTLHLSAPVNTFV
jgi:hypothetical protein